MRWHVHNEQTLYRDQWVHLTTCDVELPDGRHLDHRVVRTAADGVAGVVIQDRHVLLLWRHRFITDTWAWEIPAGGVRPGEDAAAAAAREVEEETGWRPHSMRPLVVTQPSPGIMTSQHQVFHASRATHVGPPTDGFESQRVEWVAMADIPTLIDKRDIVAGTTLVALLYIMSLPPGPAAQPS